MLFRSGQTSFLYTVADGFGGTAQGTVTIEVTAPATFQVTTFEQTDSGFHIGFNRAFDASVLNLYSGIDDAPRSPMGTADLTLTDVAGNLVRGNLVLDADGLGATYLKSDGILAAGDYTLRLSSRVDGWRDQSGQLLDGDGDGTAGDDYSRSLTVAASSSAVVSIGEVAVGPGQTLNSNAIASRLGISFSNAAGFTSGSLKLAYNPDLLNLTGVTYLNGASGSHSIVDGLLSISFSHAGLGAGTVELIRLEGDVPAAVKDNYGAKQLLDLFDVSLNGGALPALVDDGIHLADRKSVV